MAGSHASVGGIVAAGGVGERLGGELPKALREVGGASLVTRAVRALLDGGVTDIVVAAPGAHLDAVRAAVRPVAFPAGGSVTVVEGGVTRQDSVRCALQALGPRVEFVLVHDAARALAPAGLVEDVIAALTGGADAVVPVVPVTDTVKEVDGGLVGRTVDRSRLYAVQTPQGFRRQVLAAAHAAAASSDVTDDAGLVEALGVAVHTVPGLPEAFKVTRPIDLVLANALLAATPVDV
jgi:2-C-methyl-D-erythritol 4-phosphate cytidylyltransferase